MNEKKVMVGMSGGVDSSVTAALLINQGFSVSGVTLKLFNKGCASETDISDAKAVCEKLEIDHISFSLEEYFEKMIIKSFISSYENGETPNPCVNCNKYIKFSKMLEIAEETRKKLAELF